MRTIDKRGLDLVKHFEGLHLKAYRDPVGILTIGYGHTGIRHNDGSVHQGRVITKEEADNLLAYDMKFFGERVDKLVTVSLDQDQFDALTSFDFNTGALHKSTLLKKLNAGDYHGAADEFLKWNKAGGKVLRGLTRRRESERNLFLGKEHYIVKA